MKCSVWRLGATKKDDNAHVYGQLPVDAEIPSKLGGRFAHLSCFRVPLWLIIVWILSRVPHVDVEQGEFNSIRSIAMIKVSNVVIPKLFGLQL